MNTPAHMRMDARIALHCIAVVFSALLVAVISPLATAREIPTWHLVSEKNGIRVYRQDDEDSRIKRFRGITHVALENPAAIEAIINDYTIASRWAHFVSDARELSRSDYRNRRVRYLTSLPWPLADRDVVANVRLSLTGAEFEAIIDDDAKAPPTSGFVRMPALHGHLKVRFMAPSHEAELIYEAHVDPGGYIPAWLVNVVMKDIPYFTLLKLTRLSSEKPYAQYRSAEFTYPW